MKIAFLSTFYPFRGGIAQFNASLYRQLERRHSVKAFTFTRQYPGFLFPGETQYVTPDDRADPVPAEAIIDTINPFSYVTAAARVAQFAPDALITKFWMPFFAPSLGFVSGKLRKRGVRVVSVLDNVVPHERRPGDAAMIRYFLKRNDGFVVMSKTVERDLLRLMPDARYRLKPHPLYDHYGARTDVVEARRRLGLPENRKILLFFGFIRDYKGLDLLIEALPLLDETYHVVVAGEVYGSFERYRILIDRHGLAHRVSLFLRYVGDPEVPDFFSAADVCVLPYRSATQSGIVQIAFHFLVPVIVTDVGGLSEMVQDGATGLVIHDTEPRALATQVQRFFEQGLAAPFADRIDRQREQFSWSGFADTVEELCAST
jgi:glycosyltransferase involved in cell wall biosynthesis